MRSLGRMRDLQMVQARQAIRQQQILQQRTRALHELDSITSTQGARNLALQKARVSNANQLAGAQDRLARNTRALTQIENARTAANTRALRLQTRLPIAQARLAREREKYAQLPLIQSRVGGKFGPMVPPPMPPRLVAATLHAAAIERDIEGVGQRFIDLAGRQKAVRASMAATERQIGSLQLALRGLDAREARNIARADELRGSLRLLRMEEAQLAAEMNAVSRAMASQRWERIATVARSVSHLGRVLQMFGLVASAVLGVAAHAAANFSEQATLAATQVVRKFSQIGPTTNRIMTGILAQMRQFPATADEMNKSAYDVFSSLSFAGDQAQQTATGLQFLAIANKAAVAGMTPLTDVTHAAVTIMNDFGTQTDLTSGHMRQLTGFMNRAFAAVRFGRMTFREFSQVMATTVPAAKAANQTFDDMSGTMAFLTRRIPNVRMAGTAYARLLEVLQRAAPGLRNFGVNIRDSNNQLLPLPTIIDKIAKAFPNLTRSRRDIIEFFKTITAGTGTGTMGTIQARRAFTFLIQQTGQYRSILQQTVKDQGEFTRSFRAMRETPAVRWRVFINTLRSFAIEVGTFLIPVITRMTEPLQRAMKWFNSLDMQTKKNIATTAAWVAGLSLVGGTLAVVVGSVASMLVNLRMLTEGSILAKAGIVAASLAILLLADRTGLLQKAIVQLTDSWQGWLVLLGLGAVAGIRLARVLRTVRDAIMGLMAVRAMGQAIAATTATTAGLTLGMSGLVAGIAPAIIGIGALGIAALIMRRRAAQAREELQKLQATQRQFREFTTRPVRAVQAGNITQSITDQQQLALRLSDQRNRLARLLQERTQLQNIPLPTAATNQDLDRVNERIQALRGNIRDVQNASVTAGVALREMVAGQLQRQFPQRKFSKAIIADFTAVTNYLRRRLSRREIQMLLNFEARPTRRGQIPPAIANLIRGYQQARREAVKARNTISSADEARMRHGVGVAARPRQQFPLFQRAEINKVRTQFEAIGASMDSGIIQGLRKNSPRVQQAVQDVINSAYAAALKADPHHSPSPRAARQIGQPIPEGIAQGIRSKLGIIRAAMHEVSIELFSSDQLQQAQRGITPGMLQKDIATQIQQIRLFQRSLTTLAQRGAPKTLIQQLASMGPAAADSIGMLANMTDKQLKRYLNAWNQYTKLVGGVQNKHLQQINVFGQGITDSMRRYADNAKNQLSSIVDSLQNTYTEILQRNQSAFGELFQGPYMQGPIMQNRQEWGLTARPKDLLKDLQSQLSRFRQWNTAIRRLGSLGFPPALIQQVMELGPDALPMVQQLLHMPRGMRRQYIRTFRAAQTAITQQTMRDFRLQVSMYRRLGHNAATGILEGLRAQGVPIKKFFRSVALSMFPNLGRTIARGSTRQQAQAAGVTNYNYYAGQHGMSYQTWLRKTNLHNRNKRRKHK
jgi:TP901 family phage tail tape measure protein